MKSLILNGFVDNVGTPAECELQLARPGVVRPASPPREIAQ
jgi:hypothetical protein